MLQNLGVLTLAMFLFNLSPGTIENTPEKIEAKNPRVISEMSAKVETVKEETKKANYKDITVYITYYTNINDSLQGGHNDRIGVPLKDHGENVIAMPEDVPYGSYLDIEDMGEFKVVDTGEAIVWLDDSTCKVDVFIPDVDYEWIYTNTENTVKKARLYLNKEN